jgi:sensor histidine kinase YesM
MAESVSPALDRATGSARISTLYARGVFGLVAASTVLALITANGCHLYLVSHDSAAPILPSLAFGVAMWTWWAAIACAMWLVAQRHPHILSFSTTTVLLHLSVGSTLSILHLTLLQVTLRAGSHWPAWRDAYAQLNYITLSRFGADLILYGFVFGISGLLHMQSQRQRDAVLQLELERQLSKAQLKALQMQMEPHFLFNTLNAITSLVAQKRNPEAMKTLAHLNTILRVTLQRKAPEKVPFTEELRVIESYLAIQQVRFADRLQVKIEATSEALQGLVPYFLLQPIVENAVQHGIAPTEAGGLVETTVKRVGDKLWMQVRDNGCGPIDTLSKGHGIGMQNTRERLAFFYPDTHEFAATFLATGGYVVTIQIPYERIPA